VKKKIHPAAVIIAILAFVFIHAAWLFVLGFVGFFCWEGPHQRSDFTAEQQAEIARTLGFDIVPGETLTVYYYAGFWPKTIDDGYEGYWGDISGVASEEDFLSRCHEETAFYWEEHYDFEKKEYTYRAEFSTYTENGDYAYAKIKQVQGMINNLLLPYVYHLILWGGLAADLALIVTLIVNVIRRYRKQKKEKS